MYGRPAVGFEQLQSPSQRLYPWPKVVVLKCGPNLAMRACPVALGLDFMSGHHAWLSTLLWLQCTLRMPHALQFNFQVLGTHHWCSAWSEDSLLFSFVEVLQGEVVDKQTRLTAAYAKVARLEQLGQQRETNITGQLPLQTSEATLEPGPFTSEQIASMVRCLGPLQHNQQAASNSSPKAWGFAAGSESIPTPNATCLWQVETSHFAEPCTVKTFQAETCMIDVPKFNMAYSHIQVDDG